jgi:hypothetical protein
MTFLLTRKIPTLRPLQSVTATGTRSCRSKPGSPVRRRRFRIPCTCRASLRSWVQTPGRGSIRRLEPRTRFRPKSDTLPARQTRCRPPGTHVLSKLSLHPAVGRSHHRNCVHPACQDAIPVAAVRDAPPSCWAGHVAVDGIAHTWLQSDLLGWPSCF